MKIKLNTLTHTHTEYIFKIICLLSSYNIQKNLAFLFIYLLLYIYIYLINFKLDKEIFTDYKV
jgi:hypothetical protein